MLVLTRKIQEKIQIGDNIRRIPPIGVGSQITDQPLSNSPAVIRQIPQQQVREAIEQQQAPVVIVSMTTSTPEDAPRGMDFLYSGNRLNVATSRAKALCILVGSPRLYEPDCRTPLEMRLANAFCRYRELAREVAVPLRAG